MKILNKEKNVGKIVQRGLNISKKPIEAEKRSEFGHFEGDLIVGAKNTTKFNLFTLTDIKQDLKLQLK